MATIIESLACEHTLLCALFDDIGHILRDVRTVAEVRMLSRLVARLLCRHADVEQNLAYAALDQALAEKGDLSQM